MSLSICRISKEILNKSARTLRECQEYEIQVWPHINWKPIILWSFYIYKNKLAQKKNHGACKIDIGIYRASTYSILTHSVISGIKGKAGNLSDFDKSQIVTARRLGASLTETVRNGEFLLNGVFSDPSNRRAHANTAISNRNPGQRMHNWPATRRWLRYCFVGGISRTTLGSMNTVEKSLMFVCYLNIVVE